MRWIRTAWTRITTFFRRDRVEREMDAELRHHIDSHAEDLIRAGVSRQEALRQAKLALGGLDRAKEECREAIGVSLIDSFFQDVRFGLRMLRKTPGFTAIAVLTLALGIGATTAIFSVVNAVLLKPLAMEDPSRVVYVQEQWQNIFPDLSVGNFADLQRQSTSFESLCGSNDASFNLATREAPERVEGALATAGCFRAFGVRPIAGRVFTSDEDQPGRAQVVVISERLWRERVHADSAIVGRQLHINAMPYTVIGIMPKTFDPLLNNTELWIPEAFSPEKIADHDEHYLSVIGRRKPGVSLAQMQSELNVIALRLQQQYPIDDKGRGFRVTPLATALLGDQRLALRMMLAAVGFLLLIACANVANLQLARSRLRQKEIALRAALGAAPRRIMRQLLMENVVLGFAGGVAGVLLAFAGVSWIDAYGPAGVPRLDQAHIDARTLAFACGVALLSSFAFGLAPALRSASTRLNDAFKQGDARLTGSRDRIRSVIVTAEVALALVLMAGAGLLVRSALLVSRVSPGFDASNLIAGRVGLPDAGSGNPSAARQAFEQMIAATSALPGVESAAVVSRAPLAGGGSSNGLIPEGKALDPSNIINASLQITSPGYLATIRIPLKSGRDFDVSDTRNNALVAIVNETLARTAWPNETAIGKRFACCETGPKGRMDDPVWHEVIGVAADVRAWGLDRQFQPEFYIPLAQMPPSAWDWIGRTMDLVVRTKGRAVPVSELRAAVASVAPGVPMYQVSTMQQKISATLQQSRFETFLLTIFAAAALLLATVGIYGVLSFTVTQRTRDIGIRMALGATQAHVMRDVLAYGMRLTALGVVLGFAGALSGTRVLASLLYGVHPTDALTFAAVSSLLVVVALVASYLPARRAARVDPMVALRHE